MLLTATAHGLRTSILHRAMEWPDLRAATSGPRPRHPPHLLARGSYALGPLLLGAVAVAALICTATSPRRTVTSRPPAAPAD